ncbi:energy-coupled thiamine transporter ThiT [Virgibacillus alimentarius]|uniref:energy-coupled thiamine transporter ThiT n=1 Tax=Virgibacillus alimentarius TaxID=698769 RepID=UPI000492FA47|nr:MULTISPECIES: energy-coupled thiamine transporter ThiT [Virgibacillus]HLR65609.1 energy-coupled thiamine transporter ThiT [Virgibacillus sp.]
MMRKKLGLQAMIEVSIFAALAMLLDLLPSIKIIPSISISLSMIPIFIVAFRWGFLAAIISGFLWGILQVTLGDAWILTPTQAFIEYFIAFTFVGFSGLFARLVKENLKENLKGRALFWVVIAIFVGSIARYFWHFVAGVIFFKSYAIEAGKSPFIFSLITNGTTFFFTALGCAIVLVLLIGRAPQLITSANRNEGNK